MGRAWIDLSIRPPGRPDISVNPATDEIEFSFVVDDEDPPSRFTVLMSREAFDDAVELAREMELIV